jgi:hypothetical protein
MSHFERLLLVRAIIAVEIYLDPVEDRRPHTKRLLSSECHSYAVIVYQECVCHTTHSKVRWPPLAAPHCTIQNNVSIGGGVVVFIVGRAIVFHLGVLGESAGLYETIK